MTLCLTWMWRMGCHHSSYQSTRVTTRTLLLTSRAPLTLPGTWHALAWPRLSFSLLHPSRVDCLYCGTPASICLPEGTCEDATLGGVMQALRQTVCKQVHRKERAAYKLPGADCGVHPAEDKRSSQHSSAILQRRPFHRRRGLCTWGCQQLPPAWCTIKLLRSFHWSRRLRAWDPHGH